MLFLVINEIGYAKGLIAFSMFIKIGLPSGVLRGMIFSCSSPSAGINAHRVGLVWISPFNSTSIWAITSCTFDSISFTFIMFSLDVL